jgi:hypothetical protein
MEKGWHPKLSRKEKEAMKIYFTDLELGTWAGSNLTLRQAYVRIMDRIRSVAEEFKNREDDRTLVIVLSCPCCYWNPPRLEDPNKAVFVSPLHDIDCEKRPIRQMEKTPPRGAGMDSEAATVEEYLDLFRATIDAALAN